MKKRKKIKANSRQDIHSIVEHIIDLAMYKNKTGKTTFSIPYYDLIEDAEDFDPVFLNIEINTAWDSSELDTVFTETKEQNEEEANEEQNRTASKNKKH